MNLQKSPQTLECFLKNRLDAGCFPESLRALEFAKEKHAEQFRKPEELGIPYINHPMTMACHALAMGTSESYRYDSERYLVRYKDRDNKVIRFFYNERGLITRQISEWENGSVLNVVFTDYEFDEFGNWIRCIRQVKDPGEPPRSTKIIERTYSYR